MTEPTDQTTEPTEETPPPETAEEAAPPESGNREAARYRRALRETETQRDALTERVATYQRRDAERVAGEYLAVPDDLWRFGGSIEHYLDENGEVDADRVAGAVAAVLDERPGLGKGAGPRRVDLGQGKREDAASGVTWSGLLRG